MSAAKKATKKPKPRGYNFAAMGTRKFIVPIITAVAQAAVKALEIKVGFNFKITKVETYCLNRVAALTGDVKIGAVSVLAAAAVFTPATLVNAPLVGGAAKFRGGKATDSINVHYTTDGTGVGTNAFIEVTVEPT
jgi:hypothetical protein